MVHSLWLQPMARVREYSAVKTPNVPTPQTTLGNVCVTRDSKAMVKPVLVSSCNSTMGQNRRVMLSLLLKEKIKKLRVYDMAKDCNIFVEENSNDYFIFEEIIITPKSAP